jgi:hypothetical protein
VQISGNVRDSRFHSFHTKLSVVLCILACFYNVCEVGAEYDVYWTMLCVTCVCVWHICADASAFSSFAVPGLL